MKNKKQDKALSEADIHEIIQMAWCDKTSFEMIEEQTQLTSDQVKKLMKRELKPGSYKIWRIRVKKNKVKNSKKKLRTNS